MQAKSSKRINRLERLVCSGLIPEEKLGEYAEALRAMASATADKKVVDGSTRLLKALANETRLTMLRLLSKREMCVCELMVALDLTQPTASHHLNILENIGLVNYRKEGKWVFYSIANPEVAQHLFDFLGFSKD